MTIAVIGPGRVGTAFARRWHESGLVVLGFVGRDEERAEQAARYCRGRVLELGDVMGADIVFVAVGDPDVERVMAQAQSASVFRRDALWIHSSGFLGLDVLAPAAAVGASVGAIHPLCPFPDADAGYNAMPGAIATVCGNPTVAPRLAELAKKAALTPLELAPEVDRARYHAACVLAANGVTAAIDAATALLSDAMSKGDADRCVTTLAAGALELCRAHGAKAALSGPVMRGDIETVKQHMVKIGEPSILAVYRGLMFRAAELACARGAIDRGTRNRFEELFCRS